MDEGNNNMDIFVARQPIFDRRQKVFGYELLFRSSTQNFYDFTDGNRATADVVHNAFFAMGFNEITSGKRAFINFTQDLIIDELPTLLPRDQVAIEILESVEPTSEVIEACAKLKKLGYMLVLDDFYLRADYAPLIGLADIIKVDFLATEPSIRKSLVDRLGGKNLRFLAEKVETYDDFKEGLDYGYTLFQGFYFSRPVVITGKEIPVNHLTSLELLRELSQPEPDFDRIESIIKRDLAFSYNVLKLVNSAAFGLAHRLNSIKHALVMLGIRETRKLVSISLLRQMGGSKPEELLIFSIVRGRFCELLAPKIGLNDLRTDLFLMGLFSMIDALLDRPMHEILDELPISNQVKEALEGKEGGIRLILDLIIAYERGDWDSVNGLIMSLGLDGQEISDSYLQSLSWGMEFSKEKTG